MSEEKYLPPVDQRVVTALMKVGRAPMLEHFRKDSCIAATRIGLDVLKHFGIHSAKPVPLFLLIFNEEALMMLHAGASLMEVKRATEERGLSEPGGPWTLGMGADIPNSSGWAGHLMIGFPERRVLVDMSIDQASRPHKNITFEGPEFFIIPEAKWWTGEEKAASLMGETNKGEKLALLFDNRPPDPTGYRNSPNWRRISAGDGQVFRRITGEIIRLVQAELESEEDA